MAKVELFTEYKLNVPGNEFVWPVIKRQDWTFCVQTEVGKLWLEKSHINFSNEHVTVGIDQLDQYIKWLEFNLNNDSNLFIRVEEVKSESLTKTKRGKYKFDYMPHQWSELSNKWNELGLSSKDAEIPISEIDIVDSQSVAPFWLVKSKVAGGGRDSLFPIRVVTLSGLKELLSIK